METGEEVNDPLLHELQQHKSNIVITLTKKTWDESKKIWLIAGPSIFSRLALLSMTVITLAFAGHLGGLNLAAISIATTVIIAISFGFMVFATCLNISTFFAVQSLFFHYSICFCILFFPHTISTFSLCNLILQSTIK